MTTMHSYPSFGGEMMTADEKTQKFIHTDDELQSSASDMDRCREYLREIWDGNTVDYFFKPSFKEASKKYLRSASIAQQLDLGGYQDGLLRGASVMFRPDLKPWLMSLAMKQQLIRRASRARSLGRPSITSSLYTRRQSTAPELLDLLRFSVGSDATVREIWLFLRKKSDELFQARMNEKSLELRDTYLQLFSGTDHRNKANFTAENKKEAISNRKLNVAKAENQLRKTKAMAEWAENNRNYTHLLLFQHDLRNVLDGLHTENLSSKLLASQNSDEFADQQITSRLLPLLRKKKLIGLTGKLKPNLRDVLPGILPSPVRHNEVAEQQNHSATSEENEVNVTESTVTINRSVDERPLDITSEEPRPNRPWAEHPSSSVSGSETGSEAIPPLEAAQLGASYREVAVKQTSKIQDIFTPLVPIWCPKNAIAKPSE